MLNDCKEHSEWEQSSSRLAEKYIKEKLSLLGLKIRCIHEKNQLLPVEQFFNYSNNPEYYHMGDFKIILESSWNGMPIYFENKFRTKKQYKYYKKDINFEVWDDESITRKSNLQCIRSDYVGYYWMNTNPPASPSDSYGHIICDREMLVNHVKENWYEGLNYSEHLLPARNLKHTTWNCFIPWSIAEQCSMEKTIRKFLDKKKELNKNMATALYVISDLVL